MAVAGSLREAQIEAAAAGAGHVRHDAVEHLAAPLVFVEPIVQVRPQEAPALRHAERNRALDRPRRNRQRIGRRVFQVRDHVAHGRGTHAHDGRILRFVNDFVDLAGLEAAVEIHARQVGHDLSIRETRELPVAPRDEAARALDRVAHAQGVGRIVRVGHGIRGVVAIGERRVECGLRDDHLAADDAHERRPVVGGNRRIDMDEAVTHRRIELPPHPQQREALLHQEAVAHVRVRRGIQAPVGVVVEAEHALAAAIRDFVQHGAVAAPDLFRLDQIEVRRELHASARVSRGLVDVGDDLVGVVRKDRLRSRCGPSVFHRARSRRTASH